MDAAPKPTEEVDPLVDPEADEKGSGEVDERAGPKHLTSATFAGAKTVMPSRGLSQQEWDAIHKSEDPLSVFELRGHPRPRIPSVGEDGKIRSRHTTAFGQVGRAYDRNFSCPGCGTFFCWITRLHLICIGCRRKVVSIADEIKRLEAVKTAKAESAGSKKPAQKKTARGRRPAS